MIDFSEYDIKKVKRIDIMIFRDGETMNRIEWSNMQPFWRKLLCCEKKIPIKYTLKIFEGEGEK